MEKDQLHALLYEALETEKGGVQIYEMALRCAINDDLLEEWQGLALAKKQHSMGGVRDGQGKEQ